MLLFFELDDWKERSSFAVSVFGSEEIVIIEESGGNILPLYFKLFRFSK